MISTVEGWKNLTLSRGRNLMPEPTETCDHAYAAGIDARMRGEPLSANPCSGAHECRRWRAGWEECDAYYAAWRPHHWGPYQPLPSIREPVNQET